MNNIISILFAVASFASPTNYTFTDIAPKYANHIQGYVMNPTPQYVRIRAEDYIYLNEMMAERNCLFNGTYSRGSAWYMDFFSASEYVLQNPLKSAMARYSQLSVEWDSNDYIRFIRNIEYPRNEIVVSSNELLNAEWCLRNMYSGGGVEMSNDYITDRATNAQVRFALKADDLTGLFSRLAGFKDLRVFKADDDCRFRNNYTRYYSSFDENLISNFNNGSFSYYPTTSTNYTWQWDSGYDNSIVEHRVGSSYVKSLHQEEWMYYDSSADTYRYSASAVRQNTTISYDYETDLDNVLFLENAVVSTNATSRRITDVQGWVCYTMTVYAQRHKQPSIPLSGDDEDDYLPPEKLKDIDNSKKVWIPTTFTYYSGYLVDNGQVELAIWTLNPTPRAVFNTLLGEVGDDELEGGWTSVVKFSDEMPDLEKPHIDGRSSKASVTDRVDVEFSVGKVVFDYGISPTSTYEEQQ